MSLISGSVANISGIKLCRYYQEFLRSSSLCKYQLELVSSGQLSLLDFLLGGDSLGYFMEVYRNISKIVFVHTIV